MKSRENSFKHGLTGAGIVLPTEDAEELDRRFETLESEMKPNNEIARNLVNRIALLLIKLDRSAEHEAKATAHRMRKAQAEFDDARLAQMENYYSWIAAEPATNARRLRSTPEGLNRLLGVMEDLRSDLAHPEGYRWDWRRCDHLHHLLGLRREDVPVSRARALTDAMEGNFRNLNKADGADLDPKARQRWAEGALLELIDGEIAKLNTLLENFDHEGLELDRAEAAQRAIFDASPAAVLARKYEAASERGLYRALKEFREVQGEASQVESPQQFAPDLPDKMGSCLPGPPEADLESTEFDSTPGEIATEGPSPGYNGGSPRKRGHNGGLVVDRVIPDRRSSTLD